MRIESYKTETSIRIEWLGWTPSKPLREILKSLVGGYSINASSGEFSWSTTHMAEALEAGEISKTLAGGLAVLPCSIDYLQLIEIIIDDWQTVDRTMEHGQPEELAKVVETLAKKRDEIRDKLREEPYLNTSVDKSQGRFDIPVAEWESEAKASQKPSERAQ